MPLPARVRAFAERHALWTPDTRVVAAVSGGSDSVALLWLLGELSAAGALRLAGVAHLHHHVRAEADGDLAFVEALARRLDVRLHVGHADVPVLAHRESRSIEVTGREARLRFFDEALDALGGEVVALAHTRDDQAETVLLRLTRGAGPRGLAAMAPRSGRRIRPLLEIERRDLRHWLAGRGESWREDETNADLTIARNRVRHVVLPALTAINPRATDALARAARIHQADDRLLNQLAASAEKEIVNRSGGDVHLRLPGLAELPEAVSHRLLRRQIETLDPSRAYGLEGVEALLAAALAGRRWRRGRLRMERIGQECVLTRKDPLPSSPAPAGVVEAELPVPGVVRDQLGRWTIDAVGPVPASEAGSPNEWRAVLDADQAGRHLRIRGWRPGDRVQPLGMHGHKKVQDVFVDRRVPREERHLVPIVTDRHERIAWVAGHVVGAPFRVTPDSATVVILTLRH